MTEKTLVQAIMEGDRFLERAKSALFEMQKHKKVQGYYLTGTKKTAAARRASMDLTRALAELRRSL